MDSNILVINMIKYIKDNINKKITMEELSKEFFYNKDYLMRVFKKELGITIIDFINRLRVYNSLKYLEDDNYSILKIALNNGFLSQEYYSEIFRKVLGVNPFTYKHFCESYSSISEEELNNLRKTLPDLVDVINRVDLYQRNIPTYHVKEIKIK